MIKLVATLLLVLGSAALVIGASRQTGVVYHGNVSNLKPATPVLDSPNELILGGSNAAAALRKRMALVVLETRNGDIYSCTASVISKSFILCAAYCFIFGSGKKNRVFAKNCYVLVGEKKTDIQYFSSPKNKYFMKQVFLWKKYKNNGVYRHDVALIELKQEIDNSLYIPMALVDAPSSGPKQVLVAGYGNKGSFKPSGKKVLQTKVLYQEWDVCDEEMGFQVANSEAEEVCSTSKGFPRKGKTGICFGDSGGPIVIKKGRKYTQYGIASYFYGELCESPGTVFVHQNVSYFLSKITAKVQRGKNNGWKKLK